MTFAAYPSLEGRTVFVSGGATGIGADIVRAFARNHARVAFVDVQRYEGEALAAALKGTGETALFLRCDVTDVAALQASIAEARAKLGPIAVLVNNAANDERHAVADVTAAYWDHAQNVNLRHHFFAAQAVHPQMRELGHGSIVNLSSIAWRGAAEMPAYSAAKAGIIGLTHALARAFGGLDGGQRFHRSGRAAQCAEVLERNGTARDLLEIGIRIRGSNKAHASVICAILE